MVQLRFYRIALLVFTVIGCAQTKVASMDPHQPSDYVKLTHPDWSKDAVIYQLNTRQFTSQGTFNAARERLTEVHALGVDIIWLMPIHPIGTVNRKGSLGSPYSVKDYFAVNPEFGSEKDFRAFVDEAHRLGLKVIIDWVANHTAWDSVIKDTHPEWYARDYKGDYRPTPWWDWSDIIDLDFSQPGLRKYMTEAMTYWVREFDIDGYRCDVAGFVPVQFWENIRKELDKIKPVFMLAEWESRDLHAEAFDMTYAWSWQESMHAVVNGDRALSSMFKYYSWNESAYPKEAMRMTFVTNHDMNSWDGPAPERYGDGMNAAIVLSVVGEGMPLIYNGQEAGLDKRLAFFERDPIEWRRHPTGELYKSLFALKKQHTALWNAQWGATMIPVVNSAPTQVLTFVRQDSNSKIFAVINFSADSQQLTFEEKLFTGQYKEWFSGTLHTLEDKTQVSLGPWDYRVFVSQ